MALIDKKFVGNPVEIGTSAKRYQDFLMSEEEVKMEFKGIRDAAIFTNKRIMVIDPQGIRGKKVSLSSFPYSKITAFSVENSGTFDLDAELKICGSGFGIVELQFTKGVDMKAINSVLNEMLLKD